LNSVSKFTVCYVTDRRSLEATPGESRESALLRRIETAAAAGVDWIQIREKDLPARELLHLTRRAVGACGKPGAHRAGRILVRILVNDRADVAWAAGAAGVHLGDKSLPIPALLNAPRGPARADFLIGASCHSLGAALRAADEGANYIFFGPIFATPSKAAFGPPQGLAKLAEICRAVSIPVIAIGGITLENAAACAEAGAAGIAAIRLFQGKSAVREIVARLTAR
jgi:thiamine-phosphate pyrophosphorylase